MEQNIPNNNNNHHQVIILGAGVSGISAAKHLKSQDIDFLILEAQDYVGGRVKTVDGCDWGAQWIHYAQNASNPMPKLADEYQQPVQDCVEFKTLFFNLEQQRELTETETAQGEQLFCDFYNSFNTKKSALKGDNDDISVATLMQEELDKNYALDNEVVRSYFKWALNTWEHYESANMREISAKIGLSYHENKEDALGGINRSPLKGYGTLFQTIAKGFPIELNSVVQEINHLDNDLIQLTTSNQKTYSCNQLLVTVPLSVLKTPSSIKFVPPLPEKKQRAIDLMGFGLMNKIVLEFESRFWEPEIYGIMVQSEVKGAYPFYYNFYPFSKRNILICYITDDFARSKQDLAPAELVRECLEHLTAAMRLEKTPTLLSSQTTNWGKNEFARGSYSFFAPHSDFSVQKVIGEPLDNRIFFAGEGLSHHYIGSVQGAFESGLESAKRIAAVRK